MKIKLFCNLRFICVPHNLHQIDLILATFRRRWFIVQVGLYRNFVEKIRTINIRCQCFIVSWLICDRWSLQNDIVTWHRKCWLHYFDKWVYVLTTDDQVTAYKLYDDKIPPHAVKPLILNDQNCETRCQTNKLNILNWCIQTLSIITVAINN